MLNDKLLTKEYYLSKLTMFMKETYGIDAHIDILMDWIKSVDAASDYLLNVLNIWDMGGWNKGTYKKEMQETFGVKYYWRKLIEAPVKFRGEFKNNIIVNNTNLSINGDTYKYFIIPNADNPNLFWALNNSESETFTNDLYVCYYNLIEKKEIREIATPLNANNGNPLYEYSSNTDSYIKTSDTEFKNKDYFIDSKGITKATPASLRLFEGNGYEFEYKIGEYIQKGPKDLNMFMNVYKKTNDTTGFLTKAYYIREDSERAIPLNANNENPLFEYVDNTYVETTDKKFENKTYYTDTSGTVATPKNCNLYQVKATVPVGGDEFSSNPNDLYYVEAGLDEFENTIYTKVTNYNYFLDLYYSTKDFILPKTSEEKFEDYMWFSNKKEGFTEINTADLIDSKFFGLTTANNKYYFDSEKTDLATPYTLDLYFKNINDTSENAPKKTYDLDFDFTNKKYYVHHTKAKPTDEYNGVKLYVKVSENVYQETTDSSFVSGKDYYYPYGNLSDNNFKEATPLWCQIKRIGETQKVKTSYESNIELPFFLPLFYMNEYFTYKEIDSESSATSLSKKSYVFDYENPNVEETNPDAKDFIMLDVIASIVGCSRNNIVAIPYYEEEGGETVKKVRYENLPPLSNEDLLDLIKIKIIQNNYDGSLKQLLDLYQEKLDYSLFITLTPRGSAETDSYESASCTVYLQDYKSNTPDELISTNLKKLFLYSDLFIQSMGITYNKGLISDIDSLLVLGKDYIYKNEKAVYSEIEDPYANDRPSSTRLG